MIAIAETNCCEVEQLIQKKWGNKARIWATHVWLIVLLYVTSEWKYYTLKQHILSII